MAVVIITAAVREIGRRYAGFKRIRDPSNNAARGALCGSAAADLAGLPVLTARGKLCPKALLHVAKFLKHAPCWRKRRPQMQQPSGRSFGSNPSAWLRSAIRVGRWRSARGVCEVKASGRSRHAVAERADVLDPQLHHIAGLEELALPAPTPAGVPVRMMSPGCSVMREDRCAICSASVKIIWLVLESCLSTSLTHN